jgi:LEM3 (ligand-effect modulator 3) family / CDC50 family
VIVTSSKCTIYCNFVLVALLMIIGVIIRGTANSAQEYQVRFDDKCTAGTNCVFNLLIRDKMTGPIYVYLHFNNFFLNHRKVMKSLNKQQLMGNDVDLETLSTTCAGMSQNSDYPFANTSLTAMGKPYVHSAALNPCGIYASLFPQGKAWG